MPKTKSEGKTQHCKTTVKTGTVSVRKSATTGRILGISESRPRKLSARDSRLVNEQMSKSSKPNAALKEAARKYW